MPGLGGGGTSGASSARFSRRDRLGEGGMGVVYRAHDHVRRIDVALKVLRQQDGVGLFQLKNEFRGLSGIVHRNLVTLYELQASDGEWFFTMELIDGVSFLEHVRPHQQELEALRATGRAPPAIDHTITGAAPEAPATRPLSALRAATPDAPTGATRPVPLAAEPGPASAGGAAGTSGPGADLRQQVVKRAPLHAERLRAAFVQLARGVDALHAAGKLHRDLKPSNVLVDRSGRVVVCDFGLVADTAALALATGDPYTAGTPLYMSPEQASGAPLSPASDWYSVGVMLYEALPGELPFVGRPRAVLERKQVEDAPAPFTWGAEAEPELEALCRDLLRRAPEQRPGGAEVLARLGAGGVERAFPPLRLAAPRAPLVGRAPELEALRAALAASRQGRSVALFVHGPSGIGKSALLRHFLDEVQARGDAVVLEGRCYERESVPYKALDTIVDALTEHLLALPPGPVLELLSPDAAALARLFPGLRRVPAVAERRPPAISEPQELRARAFRALRELLQGLGERQPTVLFIDDLQWGDVDSAAFLLDLIHHPRPPAVLLLGSYRTEEAATSALLRALLRTEVGGGVSGDLRSLALAPLDPEQAVALALQTLDAGDAPARARAEQVAREGGGSPFFIMELARAGDDALPNVSLDELLRARLLRLAEAPLALLTACAVAARPLPSRVLSRAAGIEDEASALAVLRAERLVRTRQLGDEEQMEPYHDWIRATATRRLSEKDLRRVHRRLARTLESTAQADPLALVEHWALAGEEDKAGTYAARAAAQAEQALAFDRAAHCHRLALALLPLGDDERREMQTRLADALAQSGSLGEAAQIYLTAAEGAGRELKIELQRRALEQLLRRGRLEEGVALARQVLAQVGLSVPGSRARALASIAAGRAWLALGGRRFRARPEAERDPELLRKADVCWSASSGYSLADPVLGMAFQTRQLRYALRSGDPYRSSIALALEIGYLAAAGGKNRARVEEVGRTTLALAEQSGVRAAVGFAIAMRGFGACLAGRFRAGYDDLSAGERIMAEESVGLRWQIDVCRLYRIGALLYLGRLDELTQLVPTLLREAQERGDEYLATGLRTWRGSIAWLVLDDPDEARRQAGEDAPAAPAKASFHLQDYYQLHTRTQIDLYAGDEDAAWRRLETGWPLLESSMLLRVQSVRIEGQFLRARCALARAAARPGQRAPLLELAKACARRIAGERMAWGEPLAQLVLGCAAEQRGQAEAALASFARAQAGFDAAEMALFAAAARRRRGLLVGGDAGAVLVAAAAERMRAERIRAPDRLHALYAPARA